MTQPQPKPNDVPDAVSIQQTILLLEGFIGERVTKQTITDWIDIGSFPRSRKRNADKANSKWWIPIGDIVDYVRRNYPSGPLTTTVETDVQPVFDYICAVAYQPVPA